MKCSYRGRAQRLCKHQRELLLRLRRLQSILPGRCLFLFPVSNPLLMQGVYGQVNTERGTFIVKPDGRHWRRSRPPLVTRSWCLQMQSKRLRVSLWMGCLRPMSKRWRPASQARQATGSSKVRVLAQDVTQRPFCVMCQVQTCLTPGHTGGATNLTLCTCRPDFRDSNNPYEASNKVENVKPMGSESSLVCARKSRGILSHLT